MLSFRKLPMTCRGMATKRVMKKFQTLQLQLDKGWREKCTLQNELQPRGENKDNGFRKAISESKKDGNVGLWKIGGGKIIYIRYANFICSSAACLFSQFPFLQYDKYILMMFSSN